ncbi:MAG: RNA polymerase II holoenzyme cyclin-like subunit [Chrysothrix sp. TS-e1954]|nr:MAG: RNA polymerase II holoenzyme cyclin-like subunit [Chrysothrix sp. TS-e1954]
MASNYWLSTQHSRWQHEWPSLLETTRSTDGEENGSEAMQLPDERLIYTYIQQQINKLGKRLAIRQLVLATALVFVRRFYSRVAFSEANVFLILTTAFYLACKIEECPQHIKTITNEARNLWNALAPWDTVKIGECEFWIISELSANLVVHHPYRDILQLQSILGLSPNEATVAWYVVNDHYVTKLCLVYPPCTIAAVAATMSMTLRPSHGHVSSQRASETSGRSIAGGRMPVPTGVAASRMETLSSWLAERNDSLESYVQSVQELISLYALQESYSEMTCKEQIERFLRANELLD